MPSSVDVCVEPRYADTGKENPEPTMFEVFFTSLKGFDVFLTKKERETISEIMRETETKKCVLNIIEPYGWENTRICTRQRTDGVGEGGYIWKIEQRPPEKAKGPPGSVRDYK